mmetsp:Transcript_54750/g.173882  ORF Transcript_54750/g.173882 Transcript_54750/m.173882 type:complete len:321 (-) Transcript_54750:3096-4058(-)
MNGPKSPGRSFIIPDPSASTAAMSGPMCARARAAVVSASCVRAAAGRSLAASAEAYSLRRSPLISSLLCRGPAPLAARPICDPARAVSSSRGCALRLYLREKRLRNALLASATNLPRILKSSCWERRGSPCPSSRECTGGVLKLGTERPTSSSSADSSGLICPPSDVTDVTEASPVTAALSLLKLSSSTMSDRATASVSTWLWRTAVRRASLCTTCASTACESSCSPPGRKRALAPAALWNSISAMSAENSDTARGGRRRGGPPSPTPGDTACEDSSTSSRRVGRATLPSKSIGSSSVATSSFPRARASMLCAPWRTSHS